jgi:hypothetical protein
MSAMATDFIKRFTPTPIETTLELAGARIRLETNCQAAADQLRRALNPSTTGTPDVTDFVLRVVAESEDDLEFEVAPPVHRLSHNGLSFASLGQKSFLACDRQARHGICFISPNLVTDERRFSQHFLPALISLLTESVETSS